MLGVSYHVPMYTALTSRDISRIHSDRDLQILHFHKILKDISIMCQVLILEYGKDCSSHGNWNVAVIMAKGLGTVVGKTKIAYLRPPSNRGLAHTGLFATEN